MLPSLKEMKRPKQKQRPRARSAAELKELAASASYVGSSEHKNVRWWGRLPKGRQLPGKKVGRRGRKNTTICPLVTREDREKATYWVRQAIAEGNCHFAQGDKRYPKKIWIEADGVIWAGLCTNSELGQYKGWPSNKEERDAIFG
ncbi:MAG: hypothetical protein OXI19_11370 [Gemmatimonadota bacterium]|nr:hypothetical protein [Gemmatimonadota bacterium]